MDEPNPNSHPADDAPADAEVDVDDYTAAYDEWDDSGDAELWEAVTGDGIE